MVFGLPEPHMTRTGPVIEYIVSVADPAASIVDVVLHGKNLTIDCNWLELQMPERYAFQTFPEPFIVGPVGNAEIERVSPYLWRVRPRTGARVIVRWRVPLVHRSRLKSSPSDEYEHPYLAPDHGLLVAGTMFLLPTNAAVGEYRVKFQLPLGWPVFAPWPELAPGLFAPEEGGLVDDVIAVGAWSVHLLEVGVFRASIAYAPRQHALEALATPIISRIVAAELALFGDPSNNRYLFAFGRPDAEGFAGSPKHGSMTLSVGPEQVDAELTDHLAHLVAHEFHHTWAHSRYVSPDALRFFDEGFTDYYAYRVSAQLGFMAWDDLTKTIVAKLQQYRERLVASKLDLLAAGGPAFFANEDASQLVYTGGLVLAALLDARLRQHGHGEGLDELMRSFNNDARWMVGGVSPALSDFLVAVQRFTDEATKIKIARWLDGSAPAEIDAELAHLEPELTGTWRHLHP